MAKHSSFKNLVALEACQNFFLISGISTNSFSDATQAQDPATSDNSPLSENSGRGDSPQHQDDPIIIYTE